jgi:hypothetical protein
MSFLDLSTVAGSVNQPKLFAVYVNGTSNNTMFMDARTIVKQIVFQTASGQRIPQIPQQVQNISYSFSFYGPKINCLDADPTEARIILEFAQQSTNFSDRVVLDYFSFIPDLTQVGVNNSNRSNVIYNSDVGGSRLPDAAVASNELWIMTSKYVNGSSCEDPHSIEKQFSVCKMHEALYSIDISFTNDIQSIVDTGTKVLDAVPYPAQGVLPQGSNLTQFSYAAIMRAIDSLLLGSFSTYNPTADKAAINSSIDTNVDLTALLGSPSLSVFFDRRKSRDQCTPMGQRKNDIERSRNLTLAELIPELSYNISMAMISDSGLA